MVEAKPLEPVTADPIASRGLEHVVGAGDIGFDEIAGAVDRAVDMAFGGEMHHPVGLMLPEHAIKGGAVADVGLLEGIKRIAGDAGDVFKTGGIGERIEIDHLVPPRHGQPHHGRADKASPPSDKDLHAPSSQVNGLSRSLSKGASASLPLRTASP